MMLKQFDFRGKGSEWKEFMPASTEIDELPIEAVREIISEVRNLGDAALLNLTQ